MQSTVIRCFKVHTYQQQRSILNCRSFYKLYIILFSYHREHRKNIYIKYLLNRKYKLTYIYIYRLNLLNIHIYNADYVYDSERIINYIDKMNNQCFNKFINTEFNNRISLFSYTHCNPLTQSPRKNIQ